MLDTTWYSSGIPLVLPGIRCRSKFHLNSIVNFIENFIGDCFSARSFYGSFDDALSFVVSSIQIMLDTNLMSLVRLSLKACNLPSILSISSIDTNVFGIINFGREASLLKVFPKVLLGQIPFPDFLFRFLFRLCSGGLYLSVTLACTA